DNNCDERDLFYAELVALFITKIFAADIAERGKFWPQAAAPITRQCHGLIIAIDGGKRCRISLRNVRSLTQIVLFNCRVHFFFLSLKMRLASASDSKIIRIPTGYCNARATRPNRVISGY